MKKLVSAAVYVALLLGLTVWGLDIYKDYERYQLEKVQADVDKSWVQSAVKKFSTEALEEAEGICGKYSEFRPRTKPHRGECLYRVAQTFEKHGTYAKTEAMSACSSSYRPENPYYKKCIEERYKRNLSAYTDSELYNY